MRSPSIDPSRQVRLDELRPVRWPVEARRVLWVSLAILVALVPGLAAGPLPVWVAASLAVVAGLALAVLPLFRPLTLAMAMLVATAIAGSMLVPDAGRSLPAIVLAIPLLAIVALDVSPSPMRWERQLAWPARSIGLAALAFLGVMLLSVGASTLGGLRPNYPLVLVATSTLGLLLGLVVVPHVALRDDGRRLLFITLAALGPLLVAASVLLFFLGPFHWEGAWVGAWVHAELTLLGQPTGVVFARVTGPFEQPAGAATILAVSGVALLVLAQSGRLRRRGILLGSLAVVGLFLAFALNRDSWLILALGATGLVAAGLRRRRLDRPALATAAVFWGLLVALTLNAVGANIRPDAAVAQYGPVVAATLPGADDDGAVQLRGGASLNGRQYLWLASYEAIRERPLLGWGLGTNQEVIGQRLAPEAQRFVGLTSDSLWLRTATETGLLGLLALAAFCAASVIAIGRRLWSADQDRADAVTVGLGVLFVSLLAGGTFETYQLGGLTFPSFEIALVVGLALATRAVTPTFGRQPSQDEPHLDLTRRSAREAA